MKIYFCVMCLVTAASAFYPGDIKMVRLGVVTTNFAHYLHQKTLVSDTNSVFSPVSAHMVMTNAVLGAKGTTMTEMYDVLQLTRFDGGPLKPHEAHSNLREQYNTNTTDGNVLVVNCIYVNPTATPLVPKFVTSTLAYNISDLSTIDLANPQGPEQKINDYFKNKTEGVIQNIVKTGDIDNFSKILLASTLTVAAQWLKPFSNKTTRAPFYPTTKSSIQVDYLNDEYRDINIKKDFHGADIVELPCRRNRYSMFFLLPLPTSSLAEQVASLTKENRSKELFKGLKPQRCILSMPKLRIQSTIELSSAFKALGMVKAFDPTLGDFTALSKSGGNCISKHFHKAVLEINENGTAAVPGLAYTPPFLDFLNRGFLNVQLTRPFLMFLRDNENGITLLQGKYTGK